MFHSGRLLPVVILGIGHDDLQGDKQGFAVNPMRVSSPDSDPARKGVKTPEPVIGWLISDTGGIDLTRQVSRGQEVKNESQVRASHRPGSRRQSVGGGDGGD